MKKRLLYVLCLLLLLTPIIWYAFKQKHKVVGRWQLQTLEINGTTLQGKSLGKWIWQFNKTGKYLFTVGNAEETGSYTLAGDKLTLKSVTYKERPEQILNIIHLDSVQLDVVSADEKNKSSLHFIKNENK